MPLLDRLYEKRHICDRYRDIECERALIKKGGETMKKFLWIIIALLVVAMIVGCGQQGAKGKKLNIAFVYVGPIGDAGWTYAHNDGRLAMEELDFVEKTVYVESVPTFLEYELANRKRWNYKLQNRNGCIFYSIFLSPAPRRPQLPQHD